MQKTIAAAAILFGALGSVASAATVDLQFNQNQWAVLDFGNTSSINVIAQSNQNFSFTYAFSQDGCGIGADQYNTWSCMPAGTETNVVNPHFNSSFGQGWFDKKDVHGAVGSYQITYTDEGAENLFMFFRLNSGNNVNVSQVADVVVPPATVPLPAAGLMLMTGLAGFGGLRLLKRRKAEA